MIECTLDLDDTSMNNDYVCEMLEEYQRVADVRYTFGNSEGKIHAINRDMDKIDYDWDIVVVMSDDMKFVMEGFDEYIRAAFKTYGLDSVIHFNDGNVYGKDLMTLNVQGRDNYNRFGYLYNPEYKSLWCDNEQMEVGKILGNYHYMGDNLVIVNHLHPAWVQGIQPDNLLKKTESFYSEDEKTFNRRKSINFGL